MTDDARIPLDQPWAERWLRFADERLGPRRTRVDERRRALLRALSGQPGGRSRQAAITAISPELARAYAEKSPRAVADDIATLGRRGLTDIPEPGVVRVRAFAIFEPTPPPRPTPEQVDLLLEVLRERAPHLVGMVPRLIDGVAIPWAEANEVVLTLLTAFQQEPRIHHRHRPARADAIFDLFHLLGATESHTNSM